MRISRLLWVVLAAPLWAQTQVIPDPFPPGAGLTVSKSYTAAGIVALFSGCSGTQYLGADGACHSGGGATPGTPVLSIQYNDPLGTFAGDANFLRLPTALSTPAAPMVTPTCTVAGGEMCNSSFTYAVIAVSDVGWSQISVGTTIANGPNTPNGTNFNTISPGTCATNQIAWIVFNTGANTDIAQINCGATLQDKALAAGQYTAPAFNSSAGVYFNTNLTQPSPGTDQPMQLNLGTGYESFSALMRQSLFGFGSGPSEYNFFYHGATSLNLTGNLVSIASEDTSGSFTGGLYVAGVTAAGGNPYAAILNYGSTGATSLSSQLIAGISSQMFNLSTSTIPNSADFWSLTPRGNGAETVHYSFRSEDACNKATHYFPIWNDAAGVWAVDCLNTFNAVYQARPALYNPQFTRFVPGIANLERIVTQWESNVAVVRTEATGTGTLRQITVDGAQVNLGAASDPTAIVGALSISTAAPVGSANAAVCWKTTTTLSFCTSAVGVGGTCTCN